MELQRTIRMVVAGVAMLALAAACSHSGEPVQEPGHPAAHRATPPSIRTVLALPALLGLTVDELPRRLGPPQAVPARLLADVDQLPSAGPGKIDSILFFHYRSLDMVVSYDAGTRRFSDVVLLGNNEAQLMQRAGLSVEGPDYLVLSVFRPHQPTQLMGLRIVPIDPTQLQ